MEGNPDVKKLSDDMFDTMASADGIGLAGPQIGLSKRIFVVDGTMLEAADMKTFKQFNEKAPNTADAMKRYKAGKAGFTDIAHLKAKGLIARSDGKKKKSDKYK